MIKDFTTEHTENTEKSFLRELYKQRFSTAESAEKNMLDVVFVVKQRGTTDLGWLAGVNLAILGSFLMRNNEEQRISDCRFLIADCSIFLLLLLTTKYAKDTKYIYTKELWRCVPRKY